MFSHSLLDAIDRKLPIHLVGIGGVSMSALAQMLLHLGVPVSGSDRDETDVTRHLTELGATVYQGHRGEQLGQAALVIRTSAIKDDNPEIQAARERGIPVWERAQAWGMLMTAYRQVVCVSGTHGKTTTTSMMGCIALAASADPTIMVGSFLPAIGGTLRIGSKDLFIAESCEYCNSFLNFPPTVAMVLNVEEDHLDFFSGLPEIVSSFRAFCLKTPQDGGVVVANGDDAGARMVIENLPRRVITFGKDNSCDVYSQNLVRHNGCYCFDVYHQKQKLVSISLQVPGLHNVANALACCAASLALGFPPSAIAEGLSQFTGSARRFQRKGTLNGALVVDDYAHHPSEMAATLRAARQMDFQRIVCVFQPHTYSRTKALYGDFLHSLSLADKVILADIYAAREKDNLGVSSEQMAREIPDAEYYPSFSLIENRLRQLAQPGDLILTMGAGDIVKVGEELLA